MKTGLDVLMYFFIFLVVIAALKNPRGFATDVTAVGQSGSGFANAVLTNVPSS